MAKYKIPTHDPYTGEPNPHYEELTGKSNPWEKLKSSIWLNMKIKI